LRDCFERGRGDFLAEGPQVTSGRSTAWLLLPVLAAGFAGVWQLQRKVNLERDAMREEQDEVLVRSPKLMKMVTLEYGTLAADIYWTRAVQYYGNKRLGQDTNLESLWPLLDVATTLDPNLLPAYRFGATFLSQPEPRGAARPDLELKDYAKAGQAYLEGSKQPWAAPWMKIMAARFLEKGESRETAAMLWAELFESSTDAAIKKNARINLELLRADEDIEHINEIAKQFAAKMGHLPRSVREMMQIGLIGGEPVDPTGHAYVIGSDGKAHISEKSPLFKESSVYRRGL
jgi:hypothetical protein